MDRGFWVIVALFAAAVSLVLIALVMSPHNGEKALMFVLGGAVVGALIAGSGRSGR